MKPIHLLAVAVLLLSGVGIVPDVRAEEPSAEVVPVGPTTLEQLERALAEQSERLDKLVELARKDSRFRDVEAYKVYTIEDFSSSKRLVKAIDLLDIVADPAAPLDLRKEALEVLKSKQARSFDPDLQRSRGNSKPRNDWFRKHVTKLLMFTKSEQTRIYAADLLLSYFPGHKNDSEVLTYDAKNGTRTQWKRTATHWNKVLRK